MKLEEGETYYTGGHNCGRRFRKILQIWEHPNGYVRYTFKEWFENRKRNHITIRWSHEINDWLQTCKKVK